MHTKMFAFKCTSTFCIWIQSKKLVANVTLIYMEQMESTWCMMYVTLPGQPSGTEWPGTDVHVWQRCHTGKCWPCSYLLPSLALWLLTVFHS